MTRSAKKQRPIGGPFLAAAVFCESIVHGADGTLSAIRIIDKISVTLPADAPPDIPSDSKRIPILSWALLSFRTGGSGGGKSEVALIINSPSGKRTTGPKQDIVLSPEPSAGANVKVQFGMSVKEAGLFVIDVILNGKLMTRMPLLIEITREAPAAPAAAVKLPIKPKKAKRKRG